MCAMVTELEAGGGELTSSDLTSLNNIGISYLDIAGLTSCTGSSSWDWTEEAMCAMVNSLEVDGTDGLTSSDLTSLNNIGISKLDIAGLTSCIGSSSWDWTSEAMCAMWSSLISSGVNNVDASGMLTGVNITADLDVDSDGICDHVDLCTDTTACNYDANPTAACATNDACGVCGGSGTDADADGICDDVDLCTDTMACNYDANPTAACATNDACGVCGGTGTDSDADGICDDVDLCTDTSACNYDANPTAACATNDACGVCGGSGTDLDADGICDDVDLCTNMTACNYDANPTAA